MSNGNGLGSYTNLVRENKRFKRDIQHQKETGDSKDSAEADLRRTVEETERNEF